LTASSPRISRPFWQQVDSRCEVGRHLQKQLVTWLQLRLDFDSTAVQQPFDCLSKVAKVTVT